MIEAFIKPGTKYKLSVGIYQVMDEAFEQKAATFIERYAPIRLQEGNDRPYDFEQLPFGVKGKDSFVWDIRAEGLEFVKKQLADMQGSAILEVSTYNGWLTHHLHNWGHRVVALDLFPDDAYGLGSKFHYRNHDWISIQCDMENTAFLQPVFDMVVINHCIQFFIDPLATIAHYKGLLKPGGKLIVLGIYVYVDPRDKQQAIARNIQYYKDKYHFDIFLNTNKGYFDVADGERLNQAGVQLIPYRSVWLRNLYARLRPSKPFYYYGLFSKPSAS